MMNNQLFRHIAERPQYFLDCTNQNTKYKLVGDAYGNKAETKWVVNTSGFSVNGGPFQWIHRYVLSDLYLADLKQQRGGQAEQTKAPLLSRNVFTGLIPVAAKICYSLLFREFQLVAY